MANQLESIDLGFVNYTQHPENEEYYVFRFSDPNRANDFRIELDASKIWFEESLGEKRSKTIYLFGIHRSDFDKAQKINFKVEGHHKKPIIPFKGLRWFVILFGMSAIVLATVGYCKKHAEVTQTIQQFDGKE